MTYEGLVIHVNSTKSNKMKILYLFDKSIQGDNFVVGFCYSKQWNQSVTHIAGLGIVDIVEGLELC